MTHADEPAQDLALRVRIGGDIYERSQFHRARLDRSGLGKHGIKRKSDLTRLPPMTLDDVSTASTLLLGPDPAGSGRNKRKGRQKYWPLQWIRAGHIYLGYSSSDLDRLGAIGAEMFEAAGVRRPDVVANLLPSGPTREFMQVTLGCRKAELSYINTGASVTADEIDPLSPTVLVGRPRDLAELIESADEHAGLREVHTVFVVGASPSVQQYEKLVGHFGGNHSSVILAWAPEGVMALWSQCRGGDGLHTHPAHEVVEIVDPLTGFAVDSPEPGKLVWTGTGWYSSAVVRLDTHTPAQLLTEKCEACGRLSPRVRPVLEAKGFAGLLDTSPYVSSWYAELQRQGDADQLVVWLAMSPGASPIEAMQLVDEKLGNARVVMAEDAEIERRISDARGERFSDRRAMPEDVSFE